MFKVGDRIRRVSNPASWAPIGYETVVTGAPDDLTYTDIHGHVGFLICEGDWELVPLGPVRTVTRQEIIPGTYDGVKVHEVGNSKQTVLVSMGGEYRTSDDLDRAAAVLTALAGALRDEQ